MGEFMKRIEMLFFAVCIAAFLADCGKKQTDPHKGAITFVKGDVSVQRGDQKRKASVSQVLEVGDTIVTGPQSVATLVFGENSYVIEIESDSEFQVKADADEKSFLQNKGSSWILANKLLKTDRMSLHTPTTTAGVRGTKFYTSIYEDMTFTCHCEGQIELENMQSHSKKINDSDYLAVTKGNKTIYITPADLQKSNVPYSHEHSDLENSQLGAQSKMTPEQFRTVLELVKKKFATP
ncbi:FecR family protein [Leptospira sanjuanensis]|uniref:FecR family protein n=1 Tax=Leptospira sanjuanensis TaxID=2879643 RepID=UPI003872F6AE